MDLSHLRVAADDSEVVAIAHQRALQATVLALDGFELQRALDQRRHLLRRKRLLDEIERTALDGFDRDVESAMRGHNDNLGVRCVVIVDVHERVSRPRRISANLVSVWQWEWIATGIV